MRRWFTRAGFTELALTVTHAQRAGAFPQPHRDLFDRVLAAQGTPEDVLFLTSDASIAQFGAVLLW